MNNEEFRLSYGEDAREYVKHPILHEHRELLKRFMEDRVMCIFHSDKDGFWMEECCDNYYCHTLTKDECLELSELFGKIANKLESEKRNEEI